MLNVGSLRHFRSKVKNKAYINAHDEIHFKAIKRKGSMLVFLPILSFYYTMIQTL